jgi:muramidase (phage lysozyme)
MNYLFENNTPEIIAEKFNSTWKVGQMMMESLPESASAVFYSEINRSVESGNIDEAMKKIEKTSLICQMNLETQRHYIDLWRQMMKEGLLQ